MGHCCRGARTDLLLIDVTANTYVFNITLVGGTNSYTLDSFAAEMFNGHTYQWYVEAAAEQGDVVSYSRASTSVFTLNVPPSQHMLTAVAPAPGATVNTTEPTFQWNAVPGAVSYNVLISDTAGYGNFIPQQVTGTSYTPSTPWK